MPKVAGLSHIGLHAKDYPKMLDFYTRILGMRINHQSMAPPRAFLSAQPTVEDHEILLIGDRSAPPDTKLLQQISFRVAALGDVLNFYRLFKQENVPITLTITHGYTASIYFRDPDGNQAEVFYELPDTPHRFTAPLNFEQDEAGLLKQLHELIAAHGKT